MDNKNLIDAMVKFVEWQDEMQDVNASLTGDDRASLLMDVLNIKDSSCLIGGSNAPIFRMARERIASLNGLVARAIRGLMFISEFHYDPSGDGDPHPLDCSLAGRVSFVFGTGMTRAIGLCREHGFDPEWRAR